MREQSLPEIQKSMEIRRNHYRYSIRKRNLDGDWKLLLKSEITIEITIEMISVISKSRTHWAAVSIATLGPCVEKVLTQRVAWSQ